MRPIVGITTDIQLAAFGAWEEESALVPTDYVRAVERAGGRALLVPPSDGGIEERDRAELALLHAALERDMPVLAVCRGSQILNVGLGGDLVQHLPDVVGHDEHKHTPGEYADHDVTLERGTRLGALLGDHAPVKSHHHQGFGRIGSGLREAARAEDGTVEALEDPARRFALGVLWHPEAGEDTRLFEAFVEEARRYRRERRASSSS